MWIKICANTSAVDAQMAVELGADAVGFCVRPECADGDAGSRWRDYGADTWRGGAGRGLSGVGL